MSKRGNIRLKPADALGTLLRQRAASFVDGSIRSLIELFRKLFHSMKVLNVLAHFAKRVFVRRAAYLIVTIDSDIPAIQFILHLCILLILCLPDLFLSPHISPPLTEWLPKKTFSVIPQLRGHAAGYGSRPAPSSRFRGGTFDR
jgi:hypothetical protein